MSNAPHTIGGFTRSQLDGNWYDASGVQATAQQHDALEQLAARQQATASTRCQAHPAFEADYCPTCGTAQRIGQ